MLCFDLMEMVGQQVEQIRNHKKHKENYKKCIRDLNILWVEAAECGYDFNRGSQLHNGVFYVMNSMEIIQEEGLACGLPDSPYTM